MSDLDAIIIGGGHNGLTCAAWATSRKLCAGWGRVRGDRQEALAK
jgi:hypothetical protein